MAQARQLAEIYSQSEVPVILAGDFNSTPESDVIALLGAKWSFIDKGTDRLTFPSTGPVREIDFVALRQALAKGAPWTEDLIESLIPKAQG